MADQDPSDDAVDPDEPEKADARDRDQDSGEPSQTEQSDHSGRATEADQADRPDLPNAEKVRELAQPYIAARQAIGVRHEGTVIGGESYGFVHTLNRIVVSGPSGTRIPVVAVEPRLLEKVRAVFVPPSVAAPAMRILRDQRVLVLQGRPHWGKATLALWLLSRVDGHDAGTRPEVCAITPEVRLTHLPEGFFTAQDRMSDRYFVDTLSCEAAKALHLPVLRDLCEQLSGGYLVITVDSRAPIPRVQLRDYLVSCEEVSDPTAVLRENLRWRLDGQEPPDHVFALGWVQRELKRVPLPGHLDQLAEMLAGVVRKRMDEGDAEADYAGLGPLRVEEWFESHPDLPERCRMVAAAVLNGASYHDVADAADVLRRLFDPPEDKVQPARPPDWSLRSPRRLIAEDLGARIVTTPLSTVRGSSPSEVLQLEDDSLQRGVLEHVWSEHDVVRSTLLEWLRVLGRHDSFNVRGRAAAAVGALCRKDFVYLHDRLLLDWATAREVRARVSAAVALDVVADDRELAPEVQALLHRWITGVPRSRLAWTATAAYGLRLGVRWTKRALDDLRAVVEDVPYHAGVASRTLANLCQAGKAGPILDAIAGWVALDDPPEAAERVLNVFLRMLEIGSDVDTRSAVSNGDHGKVPTLLGLAADDERVRLRLADLWKKAFHGVRTHEQAVKALGRWINLADEGGAALQALDTVAPELLKGTSDEQRELTDVLRKWAANPRRPSSNARRYLQSLRQEVAC